ncbi:TetR family transcriptional regulator, partial [Streptomyces sp. NPDC006743]
AVRARRDRSVQEVDTFLHRATTEGLLRPDQPDGWAGPLLPELIQLAARRQTHLSAARAADVVVGTYLHGVGRSQTRSGSR